MFCAGTSGPLDPVLGEHRLNFIPQRLFDDGRMFSWIGLALMRNFAAVNSILKHQVECAAGELLVAVFVAIRSKPPLASYPCVRKRVLQGANGFEREIAPVDVDYGSGFFVV